MAETAIPLFVDLTNRKFVASAKGGEFQFKTPFHQDKLFISLQPLTKNPAGNDSSPYTVVDASEYSISFLITTTAGGTLVGPVTSWTVDGTTRYAAITLFTTEMDTAFTNAATTSISADIYIQFTGTSGKHTIRQRITIDRTYITSGTPSANPAVRYLTDADEARFVKYAGNQNGASITLTNAAGTNSIVIRVNSDGSFAADSQ